MSEYVGELNWESEIQKDSDFVLLPEGDYDFVVTDFERQRHEGSDKLPPCPKAVVTLQIKTADGDTANIKHQLFLHTKTEGLLSAFFCAIGLKKHGEKFVMNWGKVIGSTGRANVYIHKYTDDKGEERQTNRIKKFYDKEDIPVTTGRPATYQQQTFAGMPEARPQMAPDTGFQPGRF